MVFVKIRLMHVRESDTVLDSGFHAVDTGLQSLSAEPGFLIPLLVGYQARSWGLRKGVRTDTNIS